MKFTHKKTRDDVDLTTYEVKVEYTELMPFYDEAYEVLSKDVEIKGFRPGKAPKHMIETKLGTKLLNEAVGRLLPAVAFEIIDKEDRKPVNVPDYEITKVDPKDGIQFNFSFLNYPEVKLGDFKKIKVKREDTKVEDKDVDLVIKNVIKSSIPVEKIKELTKVKETKKKGKKDETPEDLDFELNDKLVEELKYESEKTLKDIRKVVRARLEELRKNENEEKYASQVIDEAIKLSKFKIPQKFLEDEIKASERDFVARLEDLNLEPEVYLSTQGSSLEKKREEWKEQATKRIEADLVLVNIAMQNDKLPLDEEIDHELSHITDAKVRESYETEQGKRYIRGVLTRQKGLQLLLETVKK